MEISDYRVPKTKVGQKTFDRIIRAGKKLFADSGFQATSINDIIAKAKVAAGTFYIYFDNKLALYLYLMDYYRVTIRQASVHATHGLTTRREMEREGLKAFINYVRKDPLAYKIIWESLFVDYAIFKEYYQSFAQSYLYHLKHFVVAGELRDDLDLETVSYVLMGIANFVGLQILFREQVEDAEVDRVVEEAMKILEGGIFLPSKTL
ncbi:MAG TPA: TetR/AcrR family transcriptional regulator [Candidatus Izemoplasmatales bacterium]|nr:TetR/AcrR family transcriptional regulator [Bacillota bacterium]HRY77341.1 TetR/AcrR family transcriptional regulator [Candidatus Izemoplasmatales bacterium]